MSYLNHSLQRKFNIKIEYLYPSPVQVQLEKWNRNPETLVFLKVLPPPLGAVTFSALEIGDG